LGGRLLRSAEGRPYRAGTIGRRSAIGDSANELALRVTIDCPRFTFYFLEGPLVVGAAAEEGRGRKAWRMSDAGGQAVCPFGFFLFTLRREPVFPVVTVFAPSGFETRKGPFGNPPRALVIERHVMVVMVGGRVGVVKGEDVVMHGKLQPMGVQSCCHAHVVIRAAQLDQSVARRTAVGNALRYFGTACPTR
jgi:hypothetical protein